MRSATKRPLAVRLLRGVGVAILLAYAFYVVAMNVFLSTPLFDRVLAEVPEDLEIHYRRAWSLWPARIHADGLDIRGSDSNVHWQLRIDTATFDVDLLALPKRRFEASRVRGSGLSIRVKQRLDAAPDTVEEIVDLPPIEGFPPFAVRPAGPPSLDRWDDSRYHLFSARLEDIVADEVREIWIDRTRFVGRAQIKGRFELEPIRSVDVGPCEIRIDEGRVMRGASREIARELGGTIALEVLRLDPREVALGELVRYLNVTTELHAKLVDPAKLALVFPAHAYVSSEIDARRVGLHVERGRLVPGTSIELATPRLLVAKNQRIGTGALALAAIVTDGAGGPKLTARLEGWEVALARADRLELMRAPRVHVTVTSSRLDLADRPLEDAHAAFDVPVADVPSARALDDLLPLGATIAVTAGTARASVKGELWPYERRMHGRAHVVAQDLALRAHELQARGRVTADASGGYRWDTDVVDGARVEVAAANVEVGTHELPRMLLAREATLSATAKRLAIDALSLRGVDARLTAGGLEVPDARALRAFLPDGRAIQIAAGRARGSAQATLAPDGAVVGASVVEVTDASVVLAKTTFRGNVTVHGALHGPDISADAFDLSGTRVAMRNVKAPGSKAWSGDVRLDKATLTLTGGPKLDAIARFDAVDARPILSLLFGDALPKVVTEMVEMPRLAAYARLALAPHSIVVSDVDASGGTVGVRGAIGLHDDERQGAFVVEKGPIAAGIGIDREGAHPHLFGLDAWLKTETAKVKTAHASEK